MDEDQKLIYREKKLIFQSKLQVPKLLKSMRFFKGKFSININEINDNIGEINGDSFKIDLVDKPETRHPLKFRYYII